MEPGNSVSKTHLPSFSIILETENLAIADIEGLSQALASLANQAFSPSYAQEFLLLDSGDAPANLLAQLRTKYPWISVRPAPIGNSYYQVKMLGAALAKGEIVVYCDSDCIYETYWLRNILTPFTWQDDIHIVAGETKTCGKGPYGTAMALTYIFPQYSGQKNLAQTHQYFLNNVAFRRTFLLQHPIPAELPLYRGNCVIHAHTLHQQGHILWRQPLARAAHAPPKGLSHFFWRFLLIGYDYYWQKRLLADLTPSSPISTQGDYGAPMVGLRGIRQVFYHRVGKMFVNNPHHIIYLPFAIPIILASVTLIFIGYLITRFRPDYLLKLGDRFL